MKSTKSQHCKTNQANESEPNSPLINTAPIKSMNLLNKECNDALEYELGRVANLNLPDFVHTIDKNLQPSDKMTDLFNAKESFTLLKQQDELLHNIYQECFEELANNGLCPKLANNILNKTLVSNQIYHTTLLKLAESIGRHNKHYEEKAATEMGNRRSLQEAEKAKKTYFNKYETSMGIMRDILLDFYSNELNLSYKLQTVLKQIEALFIKHGIPFPDTRLKRSKLFQRYLDITMMSLPTSINCKGVPKKGFKIINSSSFEKKYTFLINDCK